MHLGKNLLDLDREQTWVGRHRIRVAGLTFPQDAMPWTAGGWSPARWRGRTEQDHRWRTQCRCQMRDAGVATDDQCGPRHDRRELEQVGSPGDDVRGVDARFMSDG